MGLLVGAEVLGCVQCNDHICVDSVQCNGHCCVHRSDVCRHSNDACVYMFLGCLWEANTPGNTIDIVQC